MAFRIEDEGQIIDCVNLACASNGGSNASALQGPSSRLPATPQLPGMTAPGLNLSLKPMATAPKPGENEYFEVLVVDEFWEMGQPHTRWELVNWQDAWDGQPGGWFSEGRRRNPLGWVLCTTDLPKLP